MLKCRDIYCMVDIAQKKYSWFRKHKESNKVGSTPTGSEENWTSKARIKTSLNTEHECWNISVTSCLLCGLKMHKNYIYYMNYIHVLQNMFSLQLNFAWNDVLKYWFWWITQVWQVLSYFKCFITEFWCRFISSPLNSSSH